MPSVLVVNEISTEREEIARALEGEGFTVVQAQSAAEALEARATAGPGDEDDDPPYAALREGSAADPLPVEAAA